MKYLKTLLLALTLSASTSFAAVLVTVEQVGADVVFSFSGSLFFLGEPDGSGVNAEVGETQFLSYNGMYDTHASGVLLTTGLWTTVTTLGGFPSGDSFSFSSTSVDAPLGYSSGSPLSGTATFANKDLVSDMGFTPGDSGSFSGGGNTINFTVVPEPSTWATLAGVAMLGLACWRRKTKV